MCCWLPAQRVHSEFVSVFGAGRKFGAHCMNMGTFVIDENCGATTHIEAEEDIRFNYSCAQLGRYFLQVYRVVPGTGSFGNDINCKRFHSFEMPYVSRPLARTLIG